jgi:hypothetical protein
MVRVPDPWVIEDKLKNEKKKKERENRLPSIIPISLPEYDPDHPNNSNGTKSETEPSKSTVVIIDI